MADEEVKNGEPAKPANGAVNGAAASPEPITVPLRKPIIANGDEVNELTFREPTAGDIERIGVPVIIDMMSRDVPKITFDSKVMTQMLAALAAVPPSTIRQMHPRDWNTAAWSLANFFMPEM